MNVKFILSDYIARALAQAMYVELEDGTFVGQIPCCPGVIAFTETLRLCGDELMANFEDWLLVGLKMGHALPVPSVIRP